MLTTIEIQNLAVSVSRGAKLSFSSRENRDAVARECKKMRIPHNRGSIRGQSLDPRYVVETSNLPDKGLGNSRSYYGVLYQLERDRW